MALYGLGLALAVGLEVGFHLIIGSLAFLVQKAHRQPERVSLPVYGQCHGGSLVAAFCQGSKHEDEDGALVFLVDPEGSPLVTPMCGA